MLSSGNGASSFQISLDIAKTWGFQIVLLGEQLRLWHFLLRWDPQPSCILLAWNLERVAHWCWGQCQQSKNYCLLRKGSEPNAKIQPCFKVTDGIFSTRTTAGVAETFPYYTTTVNHGIYTARTVYLAIVPKCHFAFTSLSVALPFRRI